VEEESFSWPMEFAIDDENRFIFWLREKEGWLREKEGWKREKEGFASALSSLWTADLSVSVIPAVALFLFLLLFALGDPGSSFSMQKNSTAGMTVAWGASLSFSFSFSLFLSPLLSLYGIPDQAS
jgi:hypothetical protein